MALLQGAAPGTDIVLTEERMESSRSFANKIWNASRFLFLNMERSGVDPWVPASLEQFLPEADTATIEVPIEDRWIFSLLNRCAEETNRSIASYRYHEVAQTLWHFFWHEFCDWYLELKKLRFQENSGINSGWRNTLAAFETALRLLHPAMPFLTEELWQRFAAGRKERPVSIALAPYPRYRQMLADHEAEREIGILKDIVTLARTLRTEARLDPKLALEGTLYSRNAALDVGQRHRAAIQKLANVTLQWKNEAAPKSAAMRSTPLFDLVLHVPKAQEEAQRKRLEKERDQLGKNIVSLERQLADEKFLAKAPEKVVESMRVKLAEYQSQSGKIDHQLAEL
jgi:valyl-tRNA synthetase